MNKRQAEYMIVCQALRGVVTDRFRAVWFDIKNDETHITVILSEKREFESEALLDFEENYGALIEGPNDRYSISHKVFDGELGSQLLGKNLVFLRRERPSLSN
jgi:hypothetical protein